MLLDISFYDVDHDGAVQVWRGVSASKMEKKGWK